MGIINFSIFLFGIILGIVGSIGGGALLIAPPVFILLGLPTASAIATSKLGVFGLVVGSLFKFQKERKINWSKSLILILLTIIGASIGAKILIETGEEILKKIISGLIVFFALFALFSKEWGLKRVQKGKPSHFLGSVFYFLSSVYGGFFGGGVKFFKDFILVSFFGFSIVEAAAIAVGTGIFSSVTSLSIFYKANLINFSLGVPFALGMILGGFSGAKIMVEKGEKFTKTFLSTVAIILALLTLFIF